MSKRAYIAPNGDEYRYEGEWYGIVIGRPVRATQPVYVPNLGASYDVNGWTVASVCKPASGPVRVVLVDGQPQGVFIIVERKWVAQ